MDQVRPVSPQVEDGEHRLPTDRIGLADLGLNVDAVATERQLEDPRLLRRVARLRVGRLSDPRVDIFCARLERVQFGDEEGGKGRLRSRRRAGYRLRSSAGTA